MTDWIIAGAIAFVVSLVAQGVLDTLGVQQPFRFLISCLMSVVTVLAVLWARAGTP